MKVKEEELLIDRTEKIKSLEKLRKVKIFFKYWNDYCIMIKYLFELYYRQ